MHLEFKFRTTWKPRKKLRVWSKTFVPKRGTETTLKLDNLRAWTKISMTTSKSSQESELKMSKKESKRKNYKFWRE